MAQRTRGVPEDVNEIYQTRARMAQKLEQLEERVQESIEGARTSVYDVVERVQTAAEDVIDRVDDVIDKTKRSVDPRLQMQLHPWLMVGGAVLLGYTLGNLTNQRTEDGRYISTSDFPQGRRGETIPIRKNIWEGLTYRVQDEIEVFKGAAFAAAESLVRDLFRDIIPALAGPLESERWRKGDRGSGNGSESSR